MQIPGFSTDQSIVKKKVAEDELRQMMSSPLVDQVMAMGVSTEKIEQALKKKLETTGCGFKNAHELAQAADESPSTSASCSATAGARPIRDEEMPEQPPAAAAAGSSEAAPDEDGKSPLFEKLLNLLTLFVF